MSHGLSDKKVKIGFIGGGYIAGVHIAAAAALHDDLIIVAAADVNLAAAKALVEGIGGHAYDDVEAMLTAEDLDAVIIATWPTTHAELIGRCARHGVPFIICEKPLVLTRQDAMDIWRVTQETNVVVAEGFMYRYHPTMKRLDHVIGSGELGPIDHVRATFTYFNDPAARGIDPHDPNRPWRFRADQGGGALYDIGAYAINACTHVAQGIPERVAAFGRRENIFGTSDKVIGVIEYDNGVVGVIESSETSDATQQIEIYAERGSASIPTAWTTYGESTIMIRHSPQDPWRDQSRFFRTLESSVAVPESNAFTDQLRALVKSVRSGKPELIPLPESVLNAIIVEGLTISMRRRSVVELDVPPEIAKAVSATR